MTDYKTMNVRQKLILARKMFLDSKVEKSGKNMSMEFKYFELEDIIPVAIRIFEEVGLVSIVTLDGEKAVMTVFNVDNTEELGLDFIAPYRENKPIISNSGKQVTNDLQALGASITYLRRYLWMMVLDICEPDEQDATLTRSDDVVIKTAPKTTEQRAEIKKTLTNASGQADEMQITALKKACSELKNKSKSAEDYVKRLAVITKGFTDISRAECEKLINDVYTMLNEKDGD